MAVPEQQADAAAVERRIVTVMFADLVGFTPLSERLDAEDVATIQDGYFATVRETVQRYGGVLEKFIGDAAMAVFGVPQALDDDAERAVRAGLALVASVEHLGDRLGLAPGELQLRVGVNSGEVVYATAGPDAGRVTGDTVNTSARLQTAAAPGRVLVGEITALAVHDVMELDDPEPIVLKGKADPVRARSVIGPRPRPSRDAALGSLQAPILGRDGELARLRDVEEGLAAVVAPPGVGKSRLLAAAGAEREAQQRVLRARVRPHGLGPYEAVAELLAAADAGSSLDQALEAAGTPESRREVIRREVAALLGPSRTGAGAPRDVSSERAARFEAWTDALDALTGSPVTWIVEDIHWAAGDLLAFLSAAAGLPGQSVIASSRPSLLETQPEWVASAGTVISLAPLPAVDAGALVRALVGDALPDPLVAAVVERSHGNPLFIEELIRTWASVGTLVETDAGWRLALTPESVALPPTVQAIYAAQLDDLPSDARLVARRASVAGRRFAGAALEPLDLDGHRGGLDILRLRDFVSGPSADEVYAFRHALLRDAGYASLARQERARLHGALARWLEATGGDRSGTVAEQIAEHYAAALASLSALSGADPTLDRHTLSASAAGWFERAAEAALALAAPDSAAELLGRSVELSPADEPVNRARRRMVRGEILASTADLAAGIDELTAALAVFAEAMTTDPDGTASLLARAAYGLGLAYMQQIRFGDAEALAAQTLAHLQELGADDPRGLSRLMSLHAWAVSAQGRDDGALAEADAAAALASRADDPGLELDVMEHRTATRDELGEVEPDAWRQLGERAEALGRWRQAVIGFRIHGQLTADRDPAAGLLLVERSAELARTHGLTEQAGWGDLSRAEIQFVTGEWDAAVDAGNQALAVAERYGYTRLRFRTWMVLLPIAAARQDRELADRWELAREESPAAPSPYAVILFAAIPAWAAQARGQVPAPADDDVVDAWMPFSNPHVLAAVEVIAAGWARHGRTAPLRTMVARAAANASDDPSTPLMRSSASLMTSWLARVEGHHVEADAAAAEAARLAGSIGATWWQSRALRAGGLDSEAAVVEQRLRVVATPAT